MKNRTGQLRIYSAKELLESPLTRDTDEQTYRRAYRDGWVQALYAIGEAMFERHMSRDASHQACWQHWEDQLAYWMQRANDGEVTRETPPAVHLKGRGENTRYGL